MSRGLRRIGACPRSRTPQRHGGSVMTGFDTKQAEIDWLRTTVAALPKGSYLASILGNCAGGVEQAIRDDFGFIDFSARYDEQRAHRATVANLKAEAAEVRADIDRLKREASDLRKLIADSRTEAGV